MPVVLPPLDRRDFLRSSLAAAVAISGATATGPLAWAAASPTDVNSYALLSDVHIAANRAEVVRDVNMADHLRQAIAQIAALSRRPAAAIVAGDCALKNGQLGDYRTLVELLAPLRSGGAPVHLTMGNHDDREQVRASALAVDPTHVESQRPRLVSVLETPHANLFLLDSLLRTDFTPGELGDAQRNWLAAELDRRPDKPAIVLAHHNLQTDQARHYDGGLRDTVKTLAVLAPRKQVKVYVHGHTHRWHISQIDGLHVVNLPAVAYVFAPEQPSGWVHLQVEPDGAKLDLHTLDPQHPWDGQRVELGWRRA